VTNRTPASRSEVDRVAETERVGGEETEGTEEATGGSRETEWQENEPSPHQGEEGQQESDA
jgi:hypothetical protein